jgi:hypothetical protein
VPDVSSYINSIVWRCASLKHNLHHKSLAMAVVNRIATIKGPLPQSVVRLCDDYASDALGRRYFAPWLYVYSAVAGGFKEGWIPDNYYQNIVIPKTAGAYGDTSILKPLNYQIFGSDSFPDVGSYVNGMLLNREYRAISKYEYKSVIFRNSDRVVFKVDNSAQGVGVVIFDKSSFDIEKCTKSSNGLFQSFIDQHELLNSFARKSVATLRLTTYIDEQGAVSLRACYLRLGTGLDTHVQSNSHIRVPINTIDGRFGDLGYTADWLEVEAHPTSGERFAGKVFPSFEACVDLVKTLHKKVPFVRCVGWDVAIDAKGQPQVMEWNGGHNDIRFSEATAGPSFADLHWEQYRPRGADLFKALF